MRSISHNFVLLKLYLVENFATCEKNQTQEITVYPTRAEKFYLMKTLANQWSFEKWNKIFPLEWGKPSFSSFYTEGNFLEKWDNDHQMKWKKIPWVLNAILCWFWGSQVQNLRNHSSTKFGHLQQFSSEWRKKLPKMNKYVFYCLFYL